MISEMYASVSWEDILLVGAAMGILGGGQSLYKLRAARKNGNGQFNLRLCEERHKKIDEKLQEIKTESTTMRREVREDFKSVFRKLDAIQQNLME